MQYRFYLLDAAGQIGAAEHFHAPSDTEARAIAAELWQACCDVYPGYEVWQGAKRLSRATGWDRDDSMDLRLDLQQRVAELEEILHDGFAVFERSAKLLKRYTELRERYPKPSPAENAPRDIKA